MGLRRSGSDTSDARSSTAYCVAPLQAFAELCAGSPRLTARQVSLALPSLLSSVYWVQPAYQALAAIGTADLG